MICASHRVKLVNDFVPVHTNLNVTTFGVVGISQGGHTALLVPAMDERVSIIVSLIGSGDYEKVMREKWAMSPVGGNFDDYFPKSLQALVAKNGAMNHLPSFKDKMLLIFNTSEDQMVPSSSNNAFKRKLVEELGNEQRFYFEDFEGGHTIPKEMLERVITLINAETLKKSNL